MKRRRFDFRVLEDCFFYPRRPWRAEFTPVFGLGREQFQSHLEAGYFVQGTELYKPVCSHCADCLPIRVPIDSFTLSKSQRKLLRRNQDFQLQIAPPRLSEAKLLLYMRYHEVRWGWLPARPALMLGHMKNHLFTNWGSALEFEYQLEGQLVAFGILDALSNSANSRYFVYDPDLGGSRALGIWSLLQELHWCQQQACKYLYLGMYVPAHKTMRYKLDFRPFELRLGGEWRAFEHPDQVTRERLQEYL